MDFLLSNIAAAFLILSIIYELATCFFGYRLEHFFSTACGFILGFMLSLLAGLTLLPKNDYTLTLALIIAVGVGIAVAAVAFKFFKIGIFVFMFSTVLAFVYNIANALIQQYKLDYDSATPMIEKLLEGDFSLVNWWLFIAAVVLGIIAGILTMKYIRQTIIFATAITGAIGASIEIFKEIIKFDNLAVILIVAAALTVLGVFVQYKTTKKFAHKHR